MLLQIMPYMKSHVIIDNVLHEESITEMPYMKSHVITDNALHEESCYYR